MQYRYKNVCLEAFAYTLPDQRITSSQIETWLAPLYRRLKLPEGRLELMSGIVERRCWSPGVLPSQKSIETAQKAIRTAGIAHARIGALVHGSVCRDYLEPATACGVHHGLGLASDCTIYDVSNACLGLLNGMVQIANMIELGQIEAGVVVGTENSRPLLEATIQWLNRDLSLSRHDIKRAMASLTIGSASAAVVLVHRRLSRTGNRLMGGAARADSNYCHLCRSGRDEAMADHMRPLMSTDSETLMHEGIRVGKETFLESMDAIGWTPDQVDKTFCHQVGRAHRKLMLDTIGRDPATDYSTVEYLGNTGSVALPLTAALGIEHSHVRPNDRLALMGIGSGINALILGVEWQRSLVERVTPVCEPQVLEEMPEGLADSLSSRVS